MVIDDQNTYINSIGTKESVESQVEKACCSKCRDFYNFLKNKIDNDQNSGDSGVRLSGHAKKRLEERNINLWMVTSF